MGKMIEGRFTVVWNSTKTVQEVFNELTNSMQMETETQVHTSTGLDQLQVHSLLLHTEEFAGDYADGVSEAEVYVVFNEETFEPMLKDSNYWGA